VIGSYDVREIEWKPIPGWVGYEVSEFGDVRRAKTGRAIKPWVNGKTRYTFFSLYSRNVKKNIPAHRLVALAFLGLPPSPGYVVAHNDGTRNNNHQSNLRWDTPKGNMADRVEHGTSNRGARNGMSKLNEIDVNAIRKMAQMGIPRSLIADGFGFSRQGVDDIINRRRWRHIQDPAPINYSIDEIVSE